MGTPGTLATMPNKPKTAVRHFRLDDDLYAALQKKAADEESNATEVVRSLLEWWTRTPGAKMPKRP